MCPACLASMALVLAGATSAGGVGALLAKRLLARSRAKAPKPKEKAS